MGSLFKGKSQTTTSSQQSQPWQPAQQTLKDILGDYGDWYQNASDTGYISPTGDLSSVYSDYLSGLNNISGQSQTGTQNLLNQGTSNLNAANSLYNQVGNTNYTAADVVNGAQGLINNDVLDTQINAANKGLYQRLDEQALPGIDQAAVAGGNAGSSRAALQASMVTRDTNQIAADNAANIQANAYQNALNQSQSLLQNNTQNQLNAAQGIGNTATNQLTAANNYSSALNNSLSPLLQSSQLNQMLQTNSQADQIGNRDYIANLLSQYYLPAATAIGGMGGTSTGSQTSPGSSMFNTLLSGASAAGQAYNSFSDGRLKDNLKVIGELKNGLKIYEWTWNEEGKKIAGDKPTEGLLAQEVEMMFPEFVSVDPETGYKQVDYNVIFE